MHIGIIMEKHFNLPTKLWQFKIMIKNKNLWSQFLPNLSFRLKAAGNHASQRASELLSECTQNKTNQFWPKIPKLFFGLPKWKILTEKVFSERPGIGWYKFFFSSLLSDAKSVFVTHLWSREKSWRWNFVQNLAKCKKDYLLKN